MAYSYTSPSPVVIWTEVEIEIAKPKPQAIRPTPVIVLLNEGYRAVDLLHEVAKKELSKDVRARLIVDGELGQVELVMPRPQDSFEERLLRIVPPDDGRGSWRKKAARIGVLPGVKSVANCIAELHP